MEKEINYKVFYENPPDTVEGVFYFKKILLVFASLLFMNSAYSQAIAEVDNPKQSFGKVTKGDIVELNYVITNIGNQPLLLSKYDVECSCTSANFNSAPVLPGKSTTVTVVFDTKTVYERQDRTVLLHSNNSNGDIELRFKGFVKVE